MSPTQRVGELRPSQLLHTFGIGAVIDLPHLSTVVLGLDDWAPQYAVALTEERLLAAVRDQLGAQVTALRSPPYTPETTNPFEDWTSVGVPVAAFPRWLRCPDCRYLGRIDSGLWTFRPDAFRPDRVRYTHGCRTSGRPPDALPARFLLACRGGHLDDFPWELFCHRGTLCAAPLLELNEMGVSGDAASIEVRCRSCEAGRRMSEAFGEVGRAALPRCRGRHPHLATFDAGCREEPRTILLGATNSWFAVQLRVLSIPTWAEPLAQRVADRWAELAGITSPEILAYARTTPALAPFTGYSDRQLWQAIEAHRREDRCDEQDPLDVLGPEWAALTDPAHTPRSDDFRLETVAAPPGHRERIEQVVLGQRLREVAALIGFTRVDAPDERDAIGQRTTRAPLSRRPPSWVPCAEVRGEGIFLRLPEDRLSDWELGGDVVGRAAQLQEAHRRWRVRRRLDPDLGWRGARYVLLHTLAHALMREFALECGYGAAGIRERLYADAQGDRPMAGVLLYTAAPDSEGTLGGLVSLGQPATLSRLLDQALRAAALCSSDPMCAEHDPLVDGSLHGAACHACQFASETSCERGNRYLDRRLLVDTFDSSGIGYFA